jgi:hypothetical protein
MEPTWYDWIADIGAPVAVGVGAIAVAVGAWAVSSRTYRLSRKMRRDDLEARRREQRTATGAVLSEFCHLKWYPADQDPEDSRRLAILQTRLETERKIGKDHRLRDLIDIIFVMTRIVDGSLQPEVQRKIQISCLVLGEIAINTWVSDPDAFDPERFRARVDELEKETTAALNLFLLRAQMQVAGPANPAAVAAPAGIATVAAPGSTRPASWDEIIGRRPREFGSEYWSDRVDTVGIIGITSDWVLRDDVSPHPPAEPGRPRRRKRRGQG